MKARLLTILRWLLPAIAAVLISTALINALSKNNSSGSVTIVATVEPARYIVVDKNLTIVEILSNTSEDVRPTVLIDAVDGSQAPYTDSIQQQYQSLKPTLDFSKAGVIYQRPASHRPLVSAIANFFRGLKRIILGI